MATKEEARYIEHMDEGMKRCSTCMFYRDGSCVQVTGIIEPYGGCKFYQPLFWVGHVV